MRTRSMSDFFTLSRRPLAIGVLATLLTLGGCGASDKSNAPAPDDTNQPPWDTLTPDISADVTNQTDVTVPDATAPDGAQLDVQADAQSSDSATSDAATTDVVGTDTTPNASDASVDAGAPDTGSSDPCTGEKCSGHGTCFDLYGEALCQCESGYYLLGKTTCSPKSVPGPCNPNPCKSADKGVCSVVGGKASCSCNIGFGDVNGVCVFATCPAISAVTGLTLYDQTGGTVAGGFDPLKANDIVKVRVDIRVASGSATVTLELHPDNTKLLTDRLAFDGKKITNAKMKGPLMLIPLALTPGDHSVELQAKLVTNYAPMSLNARLTAPGACELPESRSGARIGPLGLLDAKGFGCVNLDRNRSVQVAAEVVEKSTAVYGTANGTNTNYVPNGKIVATVTQCVIRQSEQVLFLAGDALGEQPWGVDNYFVVEAFDHPPTKNEKPKKALILQASSSVSAVAPIVKIPGPLGDVRGTHIGVPNGSPFGWSAGHVRLTDLVPAGKNMWLRFYALDHGVVGRLTRVYLHSRRPPLAPAECVNNAGCVHLGKGCVKGKCVGSTCSGSCGGQPGIFCVNGYCTSQCNKGGGSCATGETCSTRACMPAGTKGMCVASNYDADCPKGETCHWGLCTKGCHHPRKQDQSYKLNADFCKSGNFCPHCPTAKQGCWNNVCGECEIDPNCTSGKVCVNRSCVTWP